MLRKVSFAYLPGKKVQLGEGAFFGEMALLGDTTRNADVVAGVPYEDLSVNGKNLKDAGFDIEFDVVDWGTMLVAFRNPPTSPMSPATLPPSSPKKP